MKYITNFLILLLCLCSSLFAQPEMIKTQDEGGPFFYCETGTVASQDSPLTSLIINITIPFDELQFLKLSAKHFEASVEMTFVLFDPDDDQVDGKNYREKVTAEDFEKTNSNQIFYSFTTKFDLPPGEYSLLCDVTDFDSKKSGRKKKKVKIRNFYTGELNISDLILLNLHNLTKQAVKSIREQFPDLLAKSTDFLIAAFEIYNPHQTARLKIKYSVLDFRNMVIQKDKFNLDSNGLVTKLNIPILKDKLSVGNYIIKLQVDDGEKKLEIENVFRTHVANLPFTIDNLDVAIEQLRYIATRGDIKKIKKAPEGKKQIYFEDYWKKLDPTPGTPTNELMDEYFRRIAFSNAHFSVFRDGWKTDMGWVYIVFGPPNDVDRQPYNVESNPYNEREVYSYELWYYFDFNRQFVFIDEQGFGDFKLTNPQDVYINR